MAVTGVRESSVTVTAVMLLSELYLRKIASVYTLEVTPSSANTVIV